MARRVRKRSFLSPLSTTVTMRAKRNLVDRQIEGAKLDKISEIFDLVSFASDLISRRLSEIDDDEGARGIYMSIICE